MADEAEQKGEGDEFAAEARSWEDSERKVALADAFADAVRAEVPMTAHTRLLEFGCGTGLVGLRFAPDVSRLTMVDTSPAMLDVLRRNAAAEGYANVYPMQGDIRCLGLPPGGHDAVIAHMALHHVDDVPGLARTFLDLLAPCGLFVAADLATEDGSFHGPDHEVPHHGFDPGDLASVFLDAGFAVCSTRAHTCFVKQDAQGGAAEFEQFLLVAERSSGEGMGC